MDKFQYLLQNSALGVRQVWHNESFDRGMHEISLEEQLQKMRADWDQRARENARHFVDTANADWTDEAFFASGEKTLAEEILTDLGNICQGKAPGEMRVLEIGCGAGRVTRALGRFFGEVHAVDVSGEMVQLAKQALKDQPNAFVYQNNGKDLTVIPDIAFDFAFSSIVFQHIPSREIIENYVREVNRLLRPGALFKFQVQGANTMDPTDPNDTWLGPPFSERQAIDMAFRCGFDPRYRYGAGEQYFWLWFFKR
jgi:SAM-dependent methyltransferase